MSIKEYSISAVVLFILIAGSNAQAETAVDEQYNFYEIQASANEDLIAELDAKSPVRSGETVYHAYTSTDIAWTFGWQPEKNGCHVTWVNTSVNILYTLPKLGYGHFDSKTSIIWNQWYKALQKHEQNHAKIAVNTAKELESSIAQLPEFSTCRLLEDYANQVGNKFIKVLGERHQKYDKRTHHGETEGARLSTYF